MCGEKYYIPQKDDGVIITPKICYKKLESKEIPNKPFLCRSRIFKKLDEIGEDFQVIEGIEEESFLQQNEEAQTINCEYILSANKNDYISNSWNSQYVQITGTLQKIDKTYYIQINYIELTNKIIITPEKEQEIKAIIENPEYIDEIAKFVTPDCYGYEQLNRLIFLTLVGLNPNELYMDTKSRQTHFIVCGSKGTSKSQIFKAWAKYAPETKYMIGSSTSKQGLLGAVVMNPILKRPVVQAGLLKLHSKGNLIIDEAGEIDEEGKTGMNGALSDSSISIHKWGQHRDYNYISTNIILISNPKGDTGSLDFQSSRLAQLDVSSTLADRFYPKVFIFDKYETQDKADVVLDYMLKFKKQETVAILTKQLIKEIMWFAKYAPNPIITQEVATQFKSLIRVVNTKYGQQKMGFREAEAICKYAMIKAKCQGKKFVDMGDFIYVFNIFDELMWQPIFKEMGTINTYIIEEKIFDAQKGNPISMSDKKRYIKNT
jgi:DNA replicative helicase MCM subunit Mcm2 (Cdc46/Mcm family)